MDIRVTADDGRQTRHRHGHRWQTLQPPPEHLAYSLRCLRHRDQAEVLERRYAHDAAVEMLISALKSQERITAPAFMP